MFFFGGGFRVNLFLLEGCASSFPRSAFFALSLPPPLSSPLSGSMGSNQGGSCGVTLNVEVGVTGIGQKKPVWLFLGPATVPPQAVALSLSFSPRQGCSINTSFTSRGAGTDHVKK